MSSGIRVVGVVKKSPADRAGLSSGFEILKINGYDAIDDLDLMFVDSLTRLEIDYKVADEIKSVVIRKRESTNLGILTEPISCRSCANNCIFCFADQNPPTFRNSLRFKDEDYRFSFLFGHYVTLSHITDREIDRIGRMRLHPLYISIHTTNDVLRRNMLGVGKSYPILPLLKRLTSHSIRFHGQIVVCPDWNDREELVRTVSDLSAFIPFLESLAVIPVGLTNHRSNAMQIKVGSPQWAQDTINRLVEVQKTLPDGWLACSDEFYLRADLPLPSGKSYGSYPQLENGVGLLRDLIDRGQKKQRFSLDLIRAASNRSSGELWIMTGLAAYPTLHELLNRWFRSEIPGCIHLMGVKNRVFGETINVAGLVCGADLIRYLEQVKSGDRVIIPSVMLREAQDRFLDDAILHEIETKIGAPISVIEPDVDSLYNVLRLFLRDLLRVSDRENNTNAGPGQKSR